MAYSIRLPDGTLVRNIPDELSPEEAKARIIKAYPQYAPPSSTLRQAADIPVQVGRGAVMGVRMLSDALGADNPVSQALRGAEDYLGDLLSAQAKKDQQEIARIMKDAEDKGILDQVKAGIEALTVAPVDLISQVLGTAAPTIVAGVAGNVAKLGVGGIRTLQAGTGAAMGTGLTKGNIYEVVKEELQAAGVDEKIAEERAKAAQNYTGENWDQIILGGALGGAAALGPLERIFARVPSISPQVAAKNIFARAGAAGVAEAVPEAAQAFQEQVAQNIALQREGFDVPTFRGAVANATLEGLAGFGIGAPIGALEGKPEAKQPPGQQETEPTPPPAGVPPGAVIPEEEALTPEEEAEFQARLAAAPPAAPVAVQPQPQPPLPPAPAAVQPPVTPPPPPAPVEQVVEEEEVIEVPPTVEQIAQQAPVTPQTKSLTDQLAQVRAARMDPMLTPEDPAFQELDRREQEILSQIEQLSVQPGQLAPSVQVGQIPPPVEPSVQVGQLPTPEVITPPPAPVITPPPAQPVITPPPTPEIVEPEEPEVRTKDVVQSELNRVRQSLKKAKTAVKKKLMPESEVTKLEARIAELDEELDQAKAPRREVKYRSAKGNTWTGKGKAPPKWLRDKLAAGYELSDFEIRPELGNKSEVEVEVEKPPGFGRPMPATRPPEEYERLAARLERAEEGGPNLFDELTGKLTDEDVIDIGRGKEFSFLRAGKGKGKFLVDLIDDGELNEFLPDAMQPESETYDAAKSEEYLKKLLRQDQSTDPEARITPEARDFLIPYLRFEISQLEAELEPEDVNQFIQEIVAEERAAIADLEASAIAEQERGVAVPPVTAEFALEGQTPEELAELQRRELSGEAEAERDRIEAEEAARAAAEAERKIADQKRETFELAPPPSAPTVRAAAPSGDLFGAQGITEQPTRAPRQVAAEPSPIEQLAAEPTAQYAKDALDEYVGTFRDALPYSGPRSYDPNTNSVTQVLTTSKDVQMLRADFDALVSIAKASDTATGRQYSILVENTPEKSSIFTFKPRRLRPTDPRVEVFAQFEEITSETPERTLAEQIESNLKDDGLDNPSKVAKKYQEEYGISKPVADALVRAEIDRLETGWKYEYGAATEAENREATKKYWDLKNRAEEISKEKKEAKPKAKKETKPAEVQTWDVFYTGTTNLAAENVEAPSAQKAKQIAAEKEGLKSIARLTAKKKEKRIKTEAAPETKKEAGAKTPREFYMEMIPAAGFKRLDPNDPRRYKNKAGEEFLTFERDGVRIAVKGNTILFAADRGVGMYMGEGTDLLLQALIVDEGARQQGRATKAMRDILGMADQAGMTTYIEPVQMTKDVGMTTDQLKAFYKRFGFEPQKAADWTEPKQPPTDRVMIREPGAKIEAAPAKAEPAKFGPTITEIMAETEALRKKAAEMGIEIGTTYVPKPDTSKQEARERKERQDLLRRAGESERIRGIGKEPIKGTPEQRSAAGRLANSVGGELLFLDGSRGLGLVLAKDKDGDNVYLPIHSGKISKVDVRYFTGLKAADKNYLVEARRELLSTVAAKDQQKKEEDDGWYFMIEMTPKKQGDLFGSPTEAKEIGKAMTEVKGKKLPPGRSPELTAAAQAVRDGKLSAAEYNKLVDTYKPIPLYAEPLKPATSEQVFDALDVKKREQINPEIPNGTKVGLRLDIPAFNRKGVFVVSIHQKRTASAPGKVIGYGSVAKAKNVTFGVGNQLKALEIAAGSAKDALQTMEGEYVNVSPDQAFAEAQRAIKDPNYVQVGIDPTRHAYFYDRRTTLPVVAAEEVIQIGNMILAKKPTFGSKSDFLYNINSAPVQSAEDLAANRDSQNQQKVQDLKEMRHTKLDLPKKTQNYASSEEGQRIIAALNMTGEELQKAIQKQYEGYTADNFMRRARKALDDGEISADVFAVVQSMYMADPKLLDGLRLDVKQKFTPEELAQRRAEGKPSPMGAFAPFERVVYLYTGTKGVTDPMTIRHELTHTLEQLMTPAQRKAVINAYIAALKKAVKKHKDAKSREFFDNVVKYLNDPSPVGRDAVNKSLPSLDLYQFTSPSEYWAVNAEKLMAQRLGTPWDRFKKAIRKMFEAMKKIFGFDNRFAVHDVFDNVISGSRKRMDGGMLADFIGASNQEYEMIENTKEDAELVRRYQRPDTPMLDHSPVKRMMINGVSFAKEEFKNMAENPSDALRMMFNSLNRGVMYLRNKFVWFGSGINEADRIRYSGQVKTAEGLATASLALDNMLRGGNIATQTLFLGGVEFNDKTLQYTAVRKEKNMTKVYEAEARLKEKLGEQLGTNIIQGYLEAKRSRSIKNEVEFREMRVEFLNEQIQEAIADLKLMDADPKTTKEARAKADRELRKLFKEYRDEKISFENMKKLAEEKVTMSDIEIDDFIAREEAHPELREIIDNFNAVNQNLLRFWRNVGLLSEARYSALASIKDYVPWYRIMNDEEDVHSPLQATTRSATNIGREKLFRSGKPSVINDFIVEENQDVFRIQPSRVNAVKLNGVRLKPEDFEATANGEVRLKVDYKPGDVVVIETQREIENMIDNMTRNVMRMTMNGLRQYAAQRIVSEYATRDNKGQIMIFPKVDREKGRFDYIHDGRRYVVEIQDPLIAEAAYGMETVGMEMWKPLAAAANFTRRTITLSPVFQLKQVFKDAPTAALVTGVKRPDMLMGGVYKGFIDAVRDTDPAAGILRSAGIGGFYSPARTPEADVKRQIGIINNNTFDYVMKALDHWGDSSDMAQRIAIYNRIMKETGDEALAMYQASNVINFLRHGSGQLAQALVKTVPFLNAYAQSIDVLYNALIGGGLRGKDRTAALKQLAFTGSLLAGTAIIYTLLVGDDDDYKKLDDQTKVRNLIIPGTDVILPMNTSAAFFFKAIPELIVNKIINEGTKNEVDAARLRTALKESAIDLLLGPTPIPSAVKPFIEISLDYNFFTSRPITPRGMENLDAYQQYDMRTSEAAKLLSGLTGTEANRLLNPMEADHLVRSIFGTAGAMVAWSSNLIGEGSSFRPEMTIKEFPVVGAFLRPEVPRGREDLFYRLKDATDRKYNTYMRLVERGDDAEADQYFKRHPNLISYYEYTTQMANDLKEINKVIRFIAEIKDPSYSAERKRAEIQELMVLKQDVLEGVEQFRKEAYAD